MTRFASYTRFLARHVRVTERILIFQVPSPLLYFTDPNAKYSHCCIERLAPTLVWPAMISPFLLPTRSAPPSPSLSSSSFLPRTSRSKEAKVEANHHAITAPGAANSDPFRERQQPPFAAPGHSLPLYRCIAKPTIFILDSAEKKASLSPPSTLFSASFLQITGGPTDRSRLLASGESIARMAPIPL